MMESLVDRTHALLRATPLMRRLAPSLAAAWHEVDRWHALYEIRRLAWQVRHGRRRTFPLRVAFAPEAPRYFHAAYLLCVRLNVDVVQPAEADVVFHWADVTVRHDPRPELDPRAINAGVRDIGKHHVSEVHAQVFGYDLEPEPGATEVVEKSDANATHDGRIVTRPSGAPGLVVERLIDNRIDEHMVIDLRVSVMDGRIICTLRRYRPIGDRFSHSGTNLVTLVVDADTTFDPDEQAHLVAMCEAMGADWADLDVLRDRTSGRLYVVDVNPTRGPPHPGLAGSELATYWRLQEHGFAALLRAHARQEP
jgi:hypothetical protein